MKKQVHKSYLPKYLRSSEEFSSTELFGMVDKIAEHQERTIFWTKMVPASIALGIVISFLILR